MIKFPHPPYGGMWKCVHSSLGWKNVCKEVSCWTLLSLLEVKRT